MTLPKRTLAALTALAAAVSIGSGTASAADPAPPANCVGPPSNTWLHVITEGVRNSDGLLAITLYADNSSKFLAHHGSIYVQRVKAQAGTSETCIFLPKPGVYALALYHDENGNRKFDRSGIGLPAEGYGFSNNPSTLAGLPSFRSVRLKVPRTDLATHIQMKYP